VRGAGLVNERHDRFWGEFFGINAADLRTPGMSIVHHAGLAGYRGVWFFLRGSRLIVSAPDAWLDRLRSGLAGEPAPPRLPSHTALVELFGTSLGRCIGPAFQGALDAGRLRVITSACVRALTSADFDVVREFRNACRADDWDDSALENAPAFRAGYLNDGHIVCMAGFRPRSATAGDPCVATLPDHRGRGYAKATVSHVLAAALADNHVVLYQTLEANAAAVGVALSLGYVRYANHIAVRLTTDEPPE
jgi:GNAT superfamily N-acetyltransferase